MTDVAITVNAHGPDDGRGVGPIESAQKIIAGQKLPDETRGFYVGVGGDVRARLRSGNVVVLRNVVSGGFYPICLTEVLDGTTAGDLVALW